MLELPLNRLMLLPATAELYKKIEDKSSFFLGLSFRLFEYPAVAG